MKVVIFCGGTGMRMKEYSDVIPKPMVEIGNRPILWHLMRYYAHYGHTEFILCLGHMGDVIKKYFLNYAEWLSNDFTLTHGGKDMTLFTTDISDWTITFIDTGIKTNIGERLSIVRENLADEPVFMANYADGLTDLCLPDYIQFFKERDKIASFLSVRPSQSFHIVETASDDHVTDIYPVQKSNMWVNGGFFIFKREIFDYIREGEELVLEPFQRLIAAEELITYRHTGFWAGIDTFKEKQMFDDMYVSGKRPWAVWRAKS